ncbi:F-box domain-containing protein [Colletotrichum orchidophilum]|uniref:F-box domain-containing protein n=1 Tax=Colletotrichum orchidophilum TaxID=1209926 RepID=A0A1G4ATT0_9PEZI|nr:F-box domain-containing protein [Colletotrichum orchidophilum]OHE92462.1 F-box domain-containing protein [Colletotrichum orchidophilum]
MTWWEETDGPRRSQELESRLRTSAGRLNDVVLGGPVEVLRLFEHCWMLSGGKFVTDTALSTELRLHYATVQWRAGSKAGGTTGIDKKVDVGDASGERDDKMDSFGDQHSVLAEQFSKLTHDDGSPDTLLRHTNLNNLVSRLTPWELIYLRQLTRESPVKLGGMQDLPEDLVAMISRYLRLGDAMKCTLVSKAWREKWTSHTVVKDIAMTYFPGLTASSPDASAWDLLRPIAQKAIARTEGKFISWLAVRTADVPLLDCTALKLDDRSLELAKSKPKPKPSRVFISDKWGAGLQVDLGFAYCNGKVAWQWDAYRFFIDDIRALTRKLVSPPDLVLKGDRDFMVSTMSENLLVLANQLNQRALIVYNLETDQHRRITLPDRMVDIQAHKDTFVVNFSSDYFANYKSATPPHIWHWSTGLVKLEVPDFAAAQELGLAHVWQEDTEEGVDFPDRFIFHPTKPHILYFVNAVLDYSKTDDDIDDDSESQAEAEKTPLRSRPSILLVKVHKFEKMNFVETFRYKSTIESPGIPRFATHCRPMNAFGLCNIGILYRPLSRGKVTTDSGLPGSKLVKTPSLSMLHLNFNTATESFVLEQRVLKGMRRPIWDSGSLDPAQAGGILWNDSIHYVQNQTPQLEGHRTRWRHEGEGQVQRSICIANKSSTLVLDTTKLWFREPVHGYHGEKFRSMAVDDDFVIGLSGRSYVVYNFGDPRLKGGPWSEAHRVRHYTAKDTDCPVWGCFGPSNSRGCLSCGVEGNSVDGSDNDWDTSDDETGRPQRADEAFGGNTTGILQATRRLFPPGTYLG